jgi:AAA+ superfamily predicted ATPase
LAADELEALIGLTSVKQLIARICTFAEMARRYRPQTARTHQHRSLHMLFVGNPGTAKTTVARLVARILHEKGVTRKPLLHEVGRADLIGEYIGHTAPRVHKAFEKARGGVLFIDEAYALCDDRGKRHFGTEAIEALIHEMENHRDEVVVILAGYPAPMNALLERNDGLVSRIKFRVEFPDYEPDELYELTKYLAAEYGYQLDSSVYPQVMPQIIAAKKGRFFGNGRWVRNIIEQAELSWALRVKNTPESNRTEKLLTTLIGEDFSSGETIYLPQPERRNIGFRCA